MRRHRRQPQVRRAPAAARPLAVAAPLEPARWALWLVGGLLAACLAAAPALGADLSKADLNSGLAAWDSDGDGSLSREEFREGMGAYGLYERWDSDRDGLITDEEYRAAPPAHFTAAEAEAWSDSGAEGLDEIAFHDRYYDAYDTNDDQTLSETEFGRFVEEVGWEDWPH